ncbi:hypothetical protein KI387_001720, partial [Taxus chinensis]
ARKRLHGKRNYTKRLLRKQPNLPKDPLVSQQSWSKLQRERNGLKNGKYKHLKDVTKARLQLKKASHKLGQGGIKSLRASMVVEFVGLPTDDEIQYALMFGYEKFRNEKLKASETIANDIRTNSTDSVTNYLGLTGEYVVVTEK